MLAQIQDRTELSSLSIVSLKAYLLSRGWKDEGPWGKRPATIFTKERAGRTWEILLPVRDTIADFPESMAESIMVLADVEKRSQLDVFYDLKGACADTIRVSSMNGVKHRTPSLRQSANLLNGAYQMLASAARAAEKPQATYRGTISSRVTEYLESVHPLPGYVQSYGVTLQSPVPARVGSQLHLGESFWPPFSRLATLKLSEALEYSSTAISEAVTENSLEPFQKVISHGVSANLCDSLAELAKRGEGIDIDLVWADVFPSNIPESHFSFSANSSDILMEAGIHFRRNQPSFDEQVSAHVVKLDRGPNEFDGRAVLLATRDGRLIQIRVEFDRSVYDIIIQAFREQRTINVDGDIFPASIGYELRNPRNLNLLSQS